MLEAVTDPLLCCPPRLVEKPERLLSLDEARMHAAEFAAPIRDSERVPLARAAGRTLALDLVARRACPHRDLSAMDGYALATLQAPGPGTCFRVEKRIAAGDPAGELSDGTAARIFTGAPMPQGATSIVMQEHVRSEGAFIVLGRQVALGENIRRHAEDVAPGHMLARAGRRLDPRFVALAAAQGIADLAVGRRPRMAVLSTGNEISGAAVDGSEAAGVFDSNRPMLLALAAGLGLDAVDAGCVRDDPGVLAGHLSSLAAHCDLIVTTGGVSVGEEDHSAAALMRAGGLGVSLKMALKPGKPAVAGRIGSATYLGLPGNPVAALVSWTLLGSAILDRMEGRERDRPPGYPLPLRDRLRRKPGRTEFVPARTHRHAGGLVLELLAGSAARLRPLAEADGLAELPPALEEAMPGELLAFHPFESLFSL